MAFGFARFDLATHTRRLELPEVSPDPAKPLTLIVRHCGAGSSLWDNAMFRRSVIARTAKDAAAPDQGDDPATSYLAASAETTALLLESQTIAGWENVSDDGEPVPHSSEAVARLVAELQQYRPDVWRRLVAYVVNRDNFELPPRAPDPTDLGKG